MTQVISRWPSVTVRIPPELDDRIEAEVKSGTLKKADIVREALARGFNMKLKDA